MCNGLLGLLVNDSVGRYGLGLTLKLTQMMYLTSLYVALPCLFPPVSRLCSAPPFPILSPSPWHRPAQPFPAPPRQADSYVTMDAKVAIL